MTIVTSCGGADYPSGQSASTHDALVRAAAAAAVGASTARHIQREPDRGFTARRPRSLASATCCNPGDSGTEATAVLGVEAGGAALDGTPLWLTMLN
jgi:hypothetical protein